ncbi:hypothetical protein XENTR_v10013183 [Xenopus tropicalis]|nr:hypothetical protein XENTR_v10013183 [Xenopus tropicalis]
MCGLHSNVIGFPRLLAKLPLSTDPVLKPPNLKFRHVKVEYVAEPVSNINHRCAVKRARIKLPREKVLSS